jgi:hypothetical protein
VGVIRTALRVAVGVLALVVYVWYAAVRLLPVVRRRKALRRRVRRD